MHFDSSLLLWCMMGQEQPGASAHTAVQEDTGLDDQIQQWCPIACIQSGVCFIANGGRDLTKTVCISANGKCLLQVYSENTQSLFLFSNLEEL